ncbi:hypothetical protein C7N43_37445 [Sphingobacteriales bacterium UPWRP_1]|nr:hypothetical protein B6N25_16345 [Sphingobacteriales bacterium TSM_CSS]PSJ71811.1 hypothetical protein C7N43_37445 [Sphingobacteriales bacterium UPWRP_1]
MAEPANSIAVQDKGKVFLGKIKPILQNKKAATIPEIYPQIAFSGFISLANFFFCYFADQ